MDESAKVHENYEMVTDPVTGEQKKSLLPNIIHETMTSQVAEYRGFALEMDEKDPWIMMFVRLAGLAFLVMTLGDGENKGRYLGVSIGLVDLSLTLNAHPSEMEPKDLKILQMGILGVAVFMFALAFRAN